MLNYGRIFLDRRIKQWRWYKDANTYRLFTHLLLSANYENHDFENITVHRGEIVTSSSKLAEELGLSRQNIRTALNHLKSTGEVTTTQHSKFTVITINNYNAYQDLTTLLTSNQPATNQQLTSNQPQCKKDKKDNKDNLSFYLSENAPKNLSTVSTIPTLEEVESFCEEISGSVDVKRFYDYYTKNNWTTKNGDPITNWKKTFLDWERREGNFESKSKKSNKSEVPESPMADAYKKLIYNIDE